MDEFTGVKKFSSPLSSSMEISSVIIYKDINKGKATFYLSLRAYGSTVSVNGNGAIILFTDGTKWSKNIKIDVEAEDKGFEYSTFIPLTLADLTILSTKKIKKFRLYIYDEELNPFEADKFKVYVKCIKTTM